MRSYIDIDRFLRTRLEVLNEDGGRGYDRGVRAFSCPVCARYLGWKK